MPYGDSTEPAGTRYCLRFGGVQVTPELSAYPIVDVMVYLDYHHVGTQPHIPTRHSLVGDAELCSHPTIELTLYGLLYTFTVYRRSWGWTSRWNETLGPSYHMWLDASRGRQSVGHI